MKLDIKNVADETYQLTTEEFEYFLSTTSWEDDVKDNHRLEFQGKIEFFEGSISY